LTNQPTVPLNKSTKLQRIDKEIIMETTSNVTKTQTTVEKTPKKKNRAFPIILLLLILGAAWFGITKYVHGQHHEDTDDAQISANISPVIPRVSGYVREIRVSDNQNVKRGDTLMVLDDRDLRIRLDQAEAALATAKSNLAAARTSTSAAQSGISTSRAAISTIDDQIRVAQVNAWRANQDYERYRNLIQDHSITQQQYDQALAAKQTADRQVQVLEDQKRQASSQTNQVTTQSTATGSQVGVAASVIKQREADVEDAKLNLSYAVITAPVDGLVTKVNIQPGQFLQAGQSFFSIVLNQALWVTANFKETQLDKMKVGLRTTISIDAFPGHQFEARVASFSPATGASTSLLPPDNATGNFVKVVQRVPVRIEFTNNNDPYLKQLRAGMNAVVDVHLD
jgi:membrane fusion protein (multidrug efflux system)